ncbi:uncharacterized protein G2W53_038628 [Senna tora]|uniref:Uncharacterized protein n=1 Tax=Senna tora TaxID=362788 RepID=A0A834W244_9FABA|nr:uncharacterized protein G2W53_038628 [Senna tora]
MEKEKENYREYYLNGGRASAKESSERQSWKIGKERAGKRGGEEEGRKGVM